VGLVLEPQICVAIKLPLAVLAAPQAKQVQAAAAVVLGHFMALAVMAVMVTMTLVLVLAMAAVVEWVVMEELQLSPPLVAAVALASVIMEMQAEAVAARRVLEVALLGGQV
jgi:hypothetical protein